MDNDTIDSIIDFFSKENKFYSEKENPDWTVDKNAGFRKRIAYTIQMLKTIKETTCD
ncbi:hypothetical protein [Leuconostoc citreum]|uniref:hypothetical protein n=1 Tax=Leuconostoc citreum TaxID=33964 RepID=UPI00140DE980|nr:hypothetical protein [Leuconostoc citreum]MCQ6659583.1 hypothetical protein [Leuconostoc citreum]QOY97099.1 hypothetical protein IRM63_06265 [Leuconostoc citreum]